jgi:quinohemoprotein ethanol dehydrogenase
MGRKDDSGLMSAALVILVAISIAGAAAHAGGKLQGSSSEDGNWPSYGRTQDATHFSPLARIDRSNVQRLGLAWWLDLPIVGRPGVPLAVDGVLFFSNAFSEIEAVDAAAGIRLWHFEPQPAVAVAAGDRLKPGWGVRGIGYWDQKIYTAAQDGRLFAIDAHTGKQLWAIQTTSPDSGLYVTGPPTLFNGKVIIGNAGADASAVRGYVTAYDATTGRQLWRFYTVPGDPAKGFENEAMAMAAKTWKGELWKQGGGGAPWNAITYDPDFNRIYVGTGDGGPWNQKIRSPGGGDNLFICSIVALDADTGRYLWHYQTTPADTWDFDGANEIELATLTIAGKPHRVLMQAAKNGFFYVVDRETGKLLSAQSFTTVTWATGIDLKTGRPIEVPGARYLSDKAPVRPFGNGGHGWQPMSFSPQTQLVYIPTTDVPSVYDDHGIDTKHWKYKPGLNFDPGNTLPSSFPKTDLPPLGSLQAWDPVAQKRVWSVPQQSPSNGGALSTAGMLVFQGQGDGRFIARAADTGKSLWSFDAQDGIVTAPITYLAGGRQYVALVTNFGGSAGVLGQMSSQMGWDYRSEHRRVLAFALGSNRRLPPAAPRQRSPRADDPAFVVDAAKAEAGAGVYLRKCFVCHGLAVVAGGTAPDLRRSSIPLSAAAFSAIVQKGGLVGRGMPRFQELTDADIEELRHYIRREVRATDTPD